MGVYMGNYISLKGGEHGVYIGNYKSLKGVNMGST